MWRTVILTGLVLGGISLISGCEGAGAPSGGRPAEVGRIGIYDSRSIAVAYVNTEWFKAETAALRKVLEDARAAGDAGLVSACERAFEQRQKEAHRQAFSTAPVDDILMHIRARIPAVLAEADAQILVSKWDEAELAKYPDAERVDVTEALMAELKPTENQLKHARAIRDAEPVPLDYFDEHDCD
jgi:hypothetical protein